MIYSVRRFSYTFPIEGAPEYISAQIDSGLGKIEDLSGQLLEDPRFKDLRPVKRHGKLINSLAKLSRRKKKKETRFSDQGNTQIKTSEANKFKTDLGRLVNTMGNSSDILK